jgi:hypothetical protein
MKGKKLRDSENNLFVREVDAKNPYGPNYEFLPFTTKLYYKYIRMKKFVRFTKEEQEFAFFKDLEFYGGILAIALFGGFLAFGTRRFLLKDKVPIVNEYPMIFDSFFGAGLATAGYEALNAHYIHTLCGPLVEKYLSEARLNGFEDYEISKDRA